MRLHLSTVITILVLLTSCTWALHNEPARHQVIEARGPHDDGWLKFPVAVSIKRDESSASPLQKRSPTPDPPKTVNPETGKSARPRSLPEAFTLTKRRVPETFKRSLHPRKTLAKRSMSAVITWYNGPDLLNPSCFADSDKWAPTDDSMVAAVSVVWPGKPPCGSFVKIHHHLNPTRHIVVRIVDSCEGCATNKAHFDLTTGAFQKLYGQEVGMVEGLKATVIPCPPALEKNWSQEVIDRYGPRKTIAYNTDNQ